MSRLADIREQDATGKAADIFAGIKKAMGKVPNAYLTIGGHSPAALQQALAHNAMLHKGSLSAQQLEAINLSVSEATGCDYCLFLMDYPRRARLKIYATVEVLAAEDHPQLLAQVAPANYRARIERLFLFHLQAFDWNCPQHITPRYSAQQVAEYSQNLQQRIHDLEQENQRLQQQLASKGDS